MKLMWSMKIKLCRRYSSDQSQMNTQATFWLEISITKLKCMDKFEDCNSEPIKVH